MIIDKKSYVLGASNGGGGGITPTGTKEITTTDEVNVATYAKAKVVDENLVAENIREGVEVLGIEGEYAPSLQAKTATQNGVVTPDAAYDGLSQVTVAVPDPELEEKWIDIKRDQTTGTNYIIVEPDDGYDGLSKLHVRARTLYNSSITANGTYEPSSDNIVGWNKVTVNVPAPDPDLVDITITENGTYTHSGHDGYDTVTVNVEGEPPAVVLSDDCSFAFYGDSGKQLIETLGDYIETTDITRANSMFENCQLTSIPFGISFDNGGPSGNLSNSALAMFRNCAIYNAPPIGGFVITNEGEENGLASMFYNSNLERLDDNYAEGSFDFTGLHEGTRSVNFSRIFTRCDLLEYVAANFVNELWFNWPYSENTFYIDAYDNCERLRKAPLPVYPCALSVNCFSGTFYNNYMLDSITFNTNDGTPIEAPWQNQFINLVNYHIGYADNIWWEDTSKRVSDAATYEALKDTEDWWTANVAYSRYNHDSAVETINSLPDCSEGSNNTIMFNSDAGELTDGGAISTLTDAEIAVATAKGWTVSLS